MGDACVPSLTVIDTTVNKLESNVPLLTIYCPRLLVVVYKNEQL